MKAMFAKCNELEELDLSNFNTSKVTNMECMFYNCFNLKILNLLKFDIKSECNKRNIFHLINKNNCKLISQNNNIKHLFYSE